MGRLTPLPVSVLSECGGRRRRGAGAAARAGVRSVGGRDDRRQAAADGAGRRAAALAHIRHRSTSGQVGLGKDQLQARGPAS